MIDYNRNHAIEPLTETSLSAWAELVTLMTRTEVPPDLVDAPLLTLIGRRRIALVKIWNRTEPLA